MQKQKSIVKNKQYLLSGEIYPLQANHFFEIYPIIDLGSYDPDIRGSNIMLKIGAKMICEDAKLYYKEFKN